VIGSRRGPSADPTPSLLAMLLASVTYWFHRYRVARLVELERVRTRIATDLHDDVGSSLSQIAILSEVARRQVEQGDARATHQLSLIARISRESVDAMSDIVWAINPQRDRLSDLTVRMRRFAGEIFPGRDIEFETSLPEQDLRLGADARRQIFLIFKECVHNMVRHSGCTRADLEVRIDEEGLVMHLRDNGRGFDPSVATTGHGLASMQRRAASLGGELHIASNQDQGTIVTLAVPRGQPSLRQT
jgi:signal transduction histidine kinase